MRSDQTLTHPDNENDVGPATVGAASPPPPHSAGATAPTPVESEAATPSPAVSAPLAPAVLVGRAAPDFTAPAVLADGEIVEDFNLRTWLGGGYGLVFFYPLDFTFVCPSEILAFSHRMADFEALETRVVAVSVDSHYAHLAWRNTPVEKGGLGPVSFPLVADLSKRIANAYGILVEPGVALRGAFLIDRQGIVRHQVVNDLALGRSVDEALRMVEALRFHDTHGEVCPANWRPGAPAMEASPEGVAKFLASHGESL